MLALQLVGKSVQARYGNRYVWGLYLAGACAGSLAMNYCMPYDTIEMPKVGADPCISAFFSFIAVQNPRLAVFTLFFPVRLWFLLALATGFVVVSDSSFKNLGGLAVGVGLGLLRRRLPI
jgi:membrane associated rhomboid family serine protease